MVSSSALASYGFGWQALWELWPLMLLCVLEGCSLGVGYHWLYRLLDGEQPPVKEATPEKIKLRELAESLRTCGAHPACHEFITFKLIANLFVTRGFY